MCASSARHLRCNKAFKHTAFKASGKRASRRFCQILGRISWRKVRVIKRESAERSEKVKASFVLIHNTRRLYALRFTVYSFTVSRHTAENSNIMWLELEARPTPLRFSSLVSTRLRFTTKVDTSCVGVAVWRQGLKHTQCCRLSGLCRNQARPPTPVFTPRTPRTGARQPC